MALVLGTTLVASAVTASAATITVIQFQASTTGCFGSGCAVFTSPASVSLGGQTVSFTGGSFDETTDVTGAASLELGTFSRTGSFTSVFNDSPFTLQVAFVLPSNIAGGQSSVLNALIDGTVTTGNSHMVVDFQTSILHFTFSNAFGAGSFDLVISDPEDLNKNQNSRPLLGGIQNATFTEYELRPVAEPGTLALFGLGLIGVARTLRRKS